MSEGIKVNNHRTNFKSRIAKFLKDEGINFNRKIKPKTAVAGIFAIGLIGGTSFFIAQFISPYLPLIIYQEITYQGLMQKASSGQCFLKLPDKSKLILKAANSGINFDKVLDVPVILKGSFTKDRNVIDVSEVKTSLRN